MPDINLEGNHPRIISALVEIGSAASEEKIFFKFHPPFFLFLAWRPSWLEVGITGHNLGMGPSKNHFSSFRGEDFLKISSPPFF